MPAHDAALISVSSNDRRGHGRSFLERPHPGGSSGTTGSRCSITCVAIRPPSEPSGSVVRYVNASACAQRRARAHEPRQPSPCWYRCRAAPMPAAFNAGKEEFAAAASNVSSTSEHPFENRQIRAERCPRSSRREPRKLILEAHILVVAVGIWDSGFGIRGSGWDSSVPAGIWSAGFAGDRQLSEGRELRTAWRLRTADCRLMTADCRLMTGD